MRLTLRQSGGFSGIVRPPVTLETGGLDDARRDRVEKLVHAAGLGVATPARAAKPPTMPDRFQYRIEVRHDNGATSALAFGEETTTPHLRKLVQLLKSVQHAKPPAPLAKKKRVPRGK